METGLAAALTTTKTTDCPAEDGAWPRDVQLYQPPEEDQILLPERASCLAVKTYLRMCKLQFSEQSCSNVEFMSTEGRLTRLPLLRIGNKLLSEFEPIVRHVEELLGGQGLSSWLDEEEREDMRSLVTNTENTCTLAELHKCFVDQQVYEGYTRLRNAAAHPWPLSTWHCHDKHRDALRLLRVYQWDELSTDGVQSELEDNLQLLDDILKEQSQELPGYIYGQQPCELDALIFGHLTAMLTTKLPNPSLALSVRNYPRLVAFCRRIDVQFFAGKQLAGED